MKIVGGILGVLAVVVLATEITMRPSPGDRQMLIAIYVGSAVATLATIIILRWFIPQARSIRLTVFATTASAVAVAAVTIALSSGLMFSSPHDLRLLVVAMALGTLLAVVLSLSVGGSLTRDLERMARVAEQVGGGDRAARTGVARRDEVGVVAGALDGMVASLDEADSLRRQTEEARAHFLAAISHDLRTPLASLQAAVEALEDDLVDDVPRYHKAMRRDIELLGGLIDDLFLLTRLEAGDLDLIRESVDLAELADEAVEVMVPLAGRNDVELKLEATGVVRTVGAPDALTRVIRNLIDNAIRFAPPDSVVRVNVVDGGSARVEVTDEGIGFKPEFVHEAFDTFTKADAARTREAGGAGLGLAIARGLIEAHGGTIWADSGPGGRVTFELPG
ncbi:MAG TPA: HAMP domain-containing histidine kinase [Actinobacteria bacterium]|nr:HAMP domain-containing histidine kinase [Actinomycetota bacterium]